MFWYSIIMAAIFLSVIETVGDTIESLDYIDEIWQNIEFAVTMLFTIEYIMKVSIVRNRCS